MHCFVGFGDGLGEKDTYLRSTRMRGGRGAELIR